MEPLVFVLFGLTGIGKTDLLRRLCSESAWPLKYGAFTKICRALKL